MSKEMFGLILGYRRGTNTQYPNEVLAKVYGVDDKSSASKLIGWKAIYIDRYGNQYNGRVIGIHGRKGVIRIVFKPNLPGQAIGEEFKLVPPSKQK